MPQVNFLKKDIKTLKDTIDLVIAEDFVQSKLKEQISKSDDDRGGCDRISITIGRNKPTASRFEGNITSRDIVVSIVLLNDYLEPELKRVLLKRLIDCSHTPSNSLSNKS